MIYFSETSSSSILDEQAAFAKQMLEEEAAAEAIAMQNEALKPKRVVIVKRQPPRPVVPVSKAFRIFIKKKPEEADPRPVVPVSKTPIININYNGAYNKYIVEDGDEEAFTLGGESRTTNSKRKFEFVEDFMDQFWKDLEDQHLEEKAQRVISYWASKNDIPNNPEWIDAVIEDDRREREAIRIFKQHMWEKKNS